METVAERLDPIQVTVTFLEMKRPPALYAHPPANLSVALMRTHDIPLHYYRYLMDRVQPLCNGLHAHLPFTTGVSERPPHSVHEPS